ncbi:hypothetical protein [Bradyrhizobium sp. USDA 3315]
MMYRVKVRLDRQSFLRTTAIQEGGGTVPKRIRVLKVHLLMLWTT